MSQDRAALPSKVVELGGGMTLRIPAAWTYGPYSDGAWWCRDMDGSVTVDLRPSIVGPIDSADGRTATPTVYALRQMEEVKALLAKTDLLGEVSVTPIQSGFILHSTGRVDDDGLISRDVRWYVIKGFNDCVGLLCVGLTAREPVDESALQDLIAHFSAEAHAVRFNLSGGPDDGLNCLQDFTMDGVITLCVPARWRCCPEEDRWYCYDPGGRPGRMWAEYNLFEIRNVPESMPGDSSAEKIAMEMAEQWDSGEDTLLSKQVDKAPLGAILHVVEDNPPDIDEAEPDSPPLRLYTWIYVAAGVSRGIITRYCLMIPQSLVDRPGLAELPGIMAREIRAQRFGEDAGS